MKFEFESSRNERVLGIYSRYKLNSGSPKIDTFCVYSKLQKCVYNGGRIQYKSNGYDMLRKEYPIFVTYYRPKSWMNTPHFEREMSRLSIVLKKKFPNFDFGY